MTAKYDFNGALALVTGGGSGMGRVVAEMLAESGAIVITVDINADGAAKTVENLKGKNHSAFKCDIVSEQAVKELATSILTKYTHPPSIVIHAAGIVAQATQTRTSMFEIKFDEVNRVIDINLKGTFLINQIFGQLMRDHKIEHAAIVNFSSVAGRDGYASLAEYCASKAGVDSLTKSFSKELAQSNIRVNAVAPYFIETPFLENFSKTRVEKAVAASPSKRKGTADEVANVVLFLASKASSYVNGQIIPVTGGF